jgi:hypothetical protein
MWRGRRCFLHTVLKRFVARKEREHTFAGNGLLLMMKELVRE